MAPEQAKGRPVDKRADIWAFGAVLYEMLTGRTPFSGDSMTEVLGAVVLKEPDWTLLPRDTPQRVRSVLRRCLEKDPKQRIRDVADAAYELSAAEPALPPAIGRKPAWLVAAVCLAVGAGPAPSSRSRFADRRPRFYKRHGGSQCLGYPRFDRGVPAVALSPDGAALAFRGRGRDGVERIYVRDFRSLELRPLAGTEGGRMPFFSPDGGWIGFFAGNSLKKVPLAGDPVRTLAPASGPSGGTWMDDGTIVFVADPTTGLQRVPSAGGTVESLLKGDETVRNSWAAPWGLPGSKAVLLLKREGCASTVVLTLADQKIRIVAQDACRRSGCRRGTGCSIRETRSLPPPLIQRRCPQAVLCFRWLKELAIASATSHVCSPPRPTALSYTRRPPHRGKPAGRWCSSTGMER